MLIEGLTRIGESVGVMAREIELADDAEAPTAARVLRNVCREEAGKFLLLLDLYRMPKISQGQMSTHLHRAGDHLAKLLYAQMADFAIGDRREMSRAIETYRASHYLDGPNDVDWIWRNELLAEREGALYTDLVDMEGDLEWWTPGDLSWVTVPKSILLVQALAGTGVVSKEGFQALRDAWVDFDHESDSRWDDWSSRTKTVLEGLSDDVVPDPDTWGSHASFAVQEWPMPLIGFDLSKREVGLEELSRARDAKYEAFLRAEYGYE